MHHPLPLSTEPVPVGRTARRVEWRFLPPHVRALVERRCGSPVVRAQSQGGGFTPGFASVLTCADGSRHFVKAAAAQAQRVFAASYREEARKLAALPGGLPAPRLLWVHDEDWVVLETQYVEARAPLRPWTRSDLDACLDALEVVADRTTPAPVSLGLRPLTEDLAEFPGYWTGLRESRPDLAHHGPAGELASRLEDALVGETLVHTDVRDDNLLIDEHGRAWICDWNWPVAGAPWFDTLTALIGPRGDGTDVDEVLAGRRLTRDVPEDDIDTALALLAGYFLTHALLPVPSASPHLRQGQAWQGEVVWDWLCARRGWN